MARIGKKPVVVDSGVKFKFDNNEFSFEGPKGKLHLVIPPVLNVSIDNNVIYVDGNEDDAHSRETRGTIRQMLNNCAVGVSKGFEKNLILEGIGYRAQVEGQKLTLFLGFSHNIEYNLPSVVSAKVDNNVKISLSSCDKQILGQTAAEIRSYRPPEPYKGKGIRYENEVVRRKVGKTGKK